MVTYEQMGKWADGQHMKDIHESGYTYLGILEIDKIKEKEMKEKFSREYLLWLRLILRLKLSKVTSVKRYGARILKWNTAELKT